jgi:hypothetical protein
MAVIVAYQLLLLPKLEVGVPDV